MSRDKILSFASEYYERHGVSPSIRAIADGVDGVDRKNFYQFFEDKAELLVALGIQEEVIKPKAAIEAKKKAAEKGGDYSITLNQAQSEKLIALSYMEGKHVTTIIDEIMEDQRQIRQVMLGINGGVLDGDIIDAILHPELVYRGNNVSDIAGQPWFVLNCNGCGGDVFVGEAVDFNKWLFLILPAIKRAIRTTCEDCQPKPHEYTRIYT